MSDLFFKIMYVIFNAHLILMGIYYFIFSVPYAPLRNATWVWSKENSHPIMLLELPSKLFVLVFNFYSQI